jgi:ABC-2 type transport system ATP-binding protein
MGESAHRYDEAHGTLWETAWVSSVLTLQGVTKRYRRGGPWVLSGADLSLEEGSLTAIVGANGSGKSTLLRVAAGVTSPSGGVARVPRKVGYVPERQAARCNFSGSDYVAHMGRIRGLSSDESARGGARLLRRLGVRPGPDVSWNELSKGNRQKVVLAQAFLGHLDSIVLDEPFSGLDDDARGVVTELIAEVRAAGTSILVCGNEPTAGVTQTYAVVEGRVEIAGPAPSPLGPEQLQRVELTQGGTGGGSAELTALTGVVRWETMPGGAGLVFDVLPAGCDRLIRTALDLGWSVRSVVPVTGKDGE